MVRRTTAADDHAYVDHRQDREYECHRGVMQDKVSYLCSRLTVLALRGICRPVFGSGVEHYGSQVEAGSIFSTYDRLRATPGCEEDSCGSAL